MGQLCSTYASCNAVSSEKIVSKEYHNSEEFKKGKEIDNEIEAESKQKVFKLLLLGPGDSGKSTTLKQMRILHDQGFSEEERLSKRRTIYSNLLNGILEMITNVQKHSLDFDIPVSVVHANTIVQYCEMQSMPPAILPENIVNTIISLFEDNLVLQALRRKTPFEIEESTRFFYQNLDRISSDGYIPSDDDLLYCRVPTMGVVQVKFFIKAYVIKVFDVGGQKSQRRKWIHIFDDVQAVLFIASLAEYNQKLHEDPKVNRLRDALELFSSICNNQWFANTAMILFLNKIDLFAEKLKIYPLTLALEHYKGPQEYRPAVDYISRKFKQKNRSPLRTLYIHETCATDTKMIEKILDSVFDVVLQQNINKMGIR